MGIGAQRWVYRGLALLLVTLATRPEHRANAQSSSAWQCWPTGLTRDCPSDYNLDWVRALDFVSATDGWAARNGLLHWDGQTWQEDASLKGQYIADVDLVSASSGMAVGMSGRTWRWDGASWLQVTSPTTYTLSAVSLLSPTDGWAVGSIAGPTTYDLRGRSVILRWNGSTWSKVSHPLPSDTSPNDLPPAEGPAEGVSSNRLQDVQALSSTSAWAVGTAGVILRWNGATWTKQTSPTSLHLHAIDMLSPTNGWAVGGNGFGGGAVIVHWNGSTWSTVNSPVYNELNDIDMVSATDGYAVGYDGVILHWDGISWTQVPAPGTTSLAAIHMLSAQQGWAGGYGGSLWRLTPPPAIVLVHGWLGFGNLDDSCAPQLTEYSSAAASPDPVFFKLLPNELRAAGYRVYFAHIASSRVATPSLETNRDCLARQLDALRAQGETDQIILIAHSMGGLVARAYLENPTYYRTHDIKALFTLGTPHHGTPVHVWAPVVLGPARGFTVLGLYCLSQVAVCQFSPLGASLFNLAHVPRRDGPTYHLIGGATPLSLEQRNLLGWITGLLLAPLQTGGAGRDDGIAPLDSSQGWYLDGTVLDRFETVENHNVFGPYEYFSGMTTPSAVYSCLLPVIQGMLTACGSVDNALHMLDAPRTTEPPTTTTPPRVEHLLPGASATYPVTTEGGETLFAAQWTTGTLSLALRSPTGELIDAAYAAAHPATVTYTAEASGAAFRVPQAIAGVWQIELVVLAAPAEGVDVQILSAVTSTIRLGTSTDSAAARPGDPVGVHVVLEGAPATAVVTATVTGADGVTQTVPLVDQGGGQFHGISPAPDAPGYAEVQVRATGTNGAGWAFERLASTLFQVSPETLALNGNYAFALVPRSPGSGFARSLNATVGVTVLAGGRAAISADLVDTQGQVVAHALTSQDVAVGSVVFTLTFAGNDLRLSGREGPYVLTHVRLAEETPIWLLADSADQVATTMGYSLSTFGDGRLFLPAIRR